MSGYCLIIFNQIAYKYSEWVVSLGLTLQSDLGHYDRGLTPWWHIQQRMALAGSELIVWRVRYMGSFTYNINHGEWVSEWLSVHVEDHHQVMADLHWELLAFLPPTKLLTHNVVNYDKICSSAKCHVSWFTRKQHSVWCAVTIFIRAIYPQFLVYKQLVLPR